MSIYEEKYNKLNKMSKHELIEYILKLTPFWYAKDNSTSVERDGIICVNTESR